MYNSLPTWGASSLESPRLGLLGDGSITGTCKSHTSAQGYFLKRHWSKLAPFESAAGLKSTPSEEKHFRAFISTIEKINQLVFFNNFSLLGVPEAIRVWIARSPKEVVAV